MPRLILIMLLVLLGLPTSVRAQSAAYTCDDFGWWENAQTAFETPEFGLGYLDTDGDGIACPDLAHGFAQAFFNNNQLPVGVVPATLEWVTDGDTINVVINGVSSPVRLILIDTPETKDPNDPVECYGAEASYFLRSLLSDPTAQLYLEKDVSDTDRYDRLLRYAWLKFDSGAVVQVNEAIVRSGYGVLSTWPPDVKWEEPIREAQQFAVRHGLGLWAKCGGADTAIGDSAQATFPSGSQPVGIAATTSQCEAAYPDICIPLGSPDIDCGQISDRRFTVLPPDPHNFDSDMDGIGCEGQ